MNELIELIQQLREKAKEHEDLLRGNESLVRYVLIDPLLRGLGQGVREGGRVSGEQSNRQGAVPGER